MIQVATGSALLPPSASSLCTICSGTSSRHCATGSFSYYKCAGCGLLYSSPIPTPAELASYYSQQYEVNREDYRMRSAVCAEKDLEIVERWTHRGRLLEVGSSWGYFLDCARRRGWEVSGVELSIPAAQWSRDTLSLNVFPGRLEESPFASGADFDAVVSAHVIEHVTQPLDFLDQIRSCLRPMGNVLLRTPNIASLPARINGVSWQWFGAPTHLFLFSPASIRRALERTGFKLIQLWTRRGDANNPWFEVMRGAALRGGLHERGKRVLGLRRTVADQERKELLDRRSEKLRRINRAADIGLCIFWPVEMCLNHFGFGPELVVLAARK